jgi:hypothetical protein
MRIGIFVPAFLAGLVVGLTGGCGGGGGGGSPPPVPIDAPFTSFRDVQPNHRYAISGISQTDTGTIGPTEELVTGFLLPADTAYSKATITYDANRIPSAIALTAPQSSVYFDNSAGNSLVCSGGSCTGSTSTAGGGAIDPIAAGWNYQAFGFWAQLPTPNTWISGVISVGAATPGNAVPTTGNATFTGAAAGFYVDPAGAIFGTGASMTANADFSTRSIGFGTSNTILTPFTGGSDIPNSGLDLSGTLTYSAGTNGFAGTVNTADTTLNGTATGQFYGPNAQEIGGTYGLNTGSGLSHMLGAFGGKQ